MDVAKRIKNAPWVATQTQVESKSQLAQNRRYHCRDCKVMRLYCYYSNTECFTILSEEGKLA